MRKQKQWLKLCVITLVVVMGSVAPAVAATEGKASDLQAVAQSYSTSKPLQQGIIVQLADGNKLAVQPASYKKSDKTFGVVVPVSAAPVTLSSDQAQEQAYVVTSGRYSVLVSTQNGVIKAGDYIGISAIDGIGMKADNEQIKIIGRAVNGFDGKANTISTTDLKTSDGKTRKAAIGSVNVDISVIPNPQRSQGANGVPSFVQDLARTVVGKPISAVQLYASLAILLMGLGLVASLLYSGIQTGMTAIGRNPLARQSIMRNMIQVIMTGVMIFLGCLIAVYLILKL